MVAAEQLAAERRKAAWGCPSGGQPPGHLRSVARAFAALFDAPPGDGCPFQGVYHGDGWCQELQLARVLVQDEGLSWAQALGRPLAAIDRDALVVTRHAEATVRRLLDEHERQKRERKGSDE